MGMFLRRGYAPHRTRFSDLAVERTIKLNWAGTPWEWLVVQQGLPSDIYDVSCDGTWLLMKDCYEPRQWNNNSSNVLETSTVHSYLNGDFINLFDDNIKNNIKQVKIPYRKNGGLNGTDMHGANGLPCKVFLLSAPEVGWAPSENIGVSGDGAKLAYFEAGNGTAATNKRIAKWNGSSITYWLRSPDTRDVDITAWVRATGNYGRNIPTNKAGIRSALILPSDMFVTDDMLA